MGFLLDVGLDYLTPRRASAGTLAGGEAQRIRLASQIGSGLVGVLYVLDEPSIGLHQRDNHRLIETLIRLRDLGNTVLVVEHDEETIKVADHVVDIGPGAGEHGGEIVYSGPGQGPAQAQGVDHRPVPVGPASRSRCPSTAARSPTRSSSSGAPASTTSRTSTSSSRSACSSPSPACRARASRRSSTTSSTASLMQKIYKSKTPPGPAQEGRGHRAPRQGHRHRPVADRPHARGRTRPPTPACSTTSASCSPRPRRPRSAATCPAASASTSRAAAARRAPATARSRSRCTSCPTCTCRARCARAPATTATPSTSRSRARTSPTCST